MTDRFTPVTFPICSGLFIHAGLVLAQSGTILAQRSEVARERTELRSEIEELRKHMAHGEGLLEGLREAITRHDLA